MPERINGLPNWETWSQNMTEEQRRYELYRHVYSIDCRLAKLERRPIWDKALAFGGGLIGGAVAVFAAYLSKTVGV